MAICRARKGRPGGWALNSTSGVIFARQHGEVGSARPKNYTEPQEWHRRVLCRKNWARARPGACIATQMDLEIDRANLA
jgi:hypothetical protein